MKETITISKKFFMDLLYDANIHEEDDFFWKVHNVTTDSYYIFYKKDGTFIPYTKKSRCFPLLVSQEELYNSLSYAFEKGIINEELRKEISTMRLSKKDYAN